MTPSHRASLVYWLTSLVGSAALGAVLMLGFMAIGREYDNPWLRALIAGPVLGIGVPLVIRLAGRARAEALRAGGSA